MSQLQPRERVLYAGTCQGIPLAQRFPAAAQAGFSAVTLFVFDVLQAQREGVEPQAISAMIAEAGLRLECYEMVAKFMPGQNTQSSAVPAGLAALLLEHTAETVCDMAATLGARSVLVGDMFGLPFEAAGAGEAIRRVAQTAGERDLDLILEFIPGSCISTVMEAAEVLDIADCSNAGIMIDSWHFFRGGSAFSDIAQIPRERLAAWQVNDASLSPAAPNLFDDMMLRAMPGEGEFDLAGLMRAIAATGTKAAGGVEVIAPASADADAAELAMRSREALDYCLNLAENHA